MADPINELKQRLETLENDPQSDVRQQIDTLIALAKELRLIDPTSGLEYGQSAYDLSCAGPFAADPYQSGIINSLLLMGDLNHLQGNYRQALSQLFAIQPIAEGIGDLKNEAKTLLTIARVYNSLGDLLDALDFALKAIQKCKKADYRQGEADAHNTIGIIYSRLGNHRQGLVEFNHALRIYRDMGYTSGVAALLNDIAMTYMALTEYDSALNSATQCLHITQQNHFEMLEANVLCTIGEIWLAKGDKDQTLEYFRTSMAMSQRLGFKYLEMYASMSSGQVYLLRHELESALSFLQQALVIADEIGTKSELYQCHLHLAEVYKRQGDFEAAFDHHEQFHAVYEAVFNEESDTKIRNLQIVHDTETAQKEAEIYRLKNVELENEITERKRAEAELRASEERYRALFERTNDAIFIFGLDSILLEVNQQAADLLGYSIDEIVGRHASDFIAPEELGESEIRKRAVLMGEILPAYERTFLRKDGTTFPAEVNLALVFDASGQPSHMHTVFRDITERQQMEQQRLEIATEREKSRILAQFIEHALHEFRTPLSVINFNLYMLDTTIDNPQQKGYLDKIKIQSESILSLVETLVNMAKMDNGEHLVLETMSINSIFDGILTSRQALLRQYNLTATIVKGENVPPIQGDVEKLGLALGGILDNAIQHSPTDSAISIRTYLEDHYVVAEIRDSGVGIHETDLPRIFERFWRKDEAHTTPGFGLGLPIAKQIIDRHRGIIKVESAPAVGSVFKIMLPIHQENDPTPN